MRKWKSKEKELEMLEEIWKRKLERRSIIKIR